MRRNMCKITVLLMCVTISSGFLRVRRIETLGKPGQCDKIYTVSEDDVVYFDDILSSQGRKRIKLKSTPRSRRMHVDKTVVTETSPVELRMPYSVGRQEVSEVGHKNRLRWNMASKEDILFPNLVRKKAIREEKFVEAFWPPPPPTTTISSREIYNDNYVNPEMYERKVALQRQLKRDRGLDLPKYKTAPVAEHEKIFADLQILKSGRGLTGLPSEEEPFTSTMSQPEVDSVPASLPQEKKFDESNRSRDSDDVSSKPRSKREVRVTKLKNRFGLSEVLYRDTCKWTFRKGPGCRSLVVTFHYWTDGIRNCDLEYILLEGGHKRHPSQRMCELREVKKYEVNDDSVTISHYLKEDAGPGVTRFRGDVQCV